MNETIITTGNGTWAVKASDSGVVETVQIAAQGSQAPEPTRNDKIQMAVVSRVEIFAKEAKRVVGEMGIGDFDGNFEPIFQTVFHTMINKYEREVNGK